MLQSDLIRMTNAALRVHFRVFYGEKIFICPAVWLADQSMTTLKLSPDLFIIFNHIVKTDTIFIKIVGCLQYTL